MRFTMGKYFIFVIFGLFYIYIRLFMVKAVLLTYDSFVTILSCIY